MKKFACPSSEKLKHRKDIALLLKKGKWTVSGSIRMVWLYTDEIDQSKIGVSVSKRFFKRAVDRNRIKRLLRESYRLNKEEFYQVFDQKVMVMFFWTSSKLPKSYEEVKKEFLKLLHSKR